MPLKRVLIVEDSIDVGRFYQDTIRAAYPGVLITFIPSAEEAILEASRYNYELLITDVRLPGMSGFDLARKIRLRQPEIRIFIITGLAIDPSLRQLSETVKADLLLSKPVGVSDFLAAVENMTGEAPHFSAAEVETAGRAPRKKAGGLRHSASDDPRTELHPVPSQKAPTKPLHAARDRAQSEPEETPPPLLGALLADLRGSLGALAAILLDDQGRVAAQAGDWPEPGLEAQLVPGLMAGLSGLAKISSQLREGLPAAAHALRGKTFDLAFAPVGRFAVLVFLRSSNSALRLALAFEHLLTVQDQLAQALEGMGLNIRPLPEAALPAPEPQSEAVPLPPPAAALVEAGPSGGESLPEESESLAALAALFGPNKTVAIPQDANDYWDNLVTGGASSSPSLPTTGELSYEQARKLGLMPEEK